MKDGGWLDVWMVVGCFWGGMGGGFDWSFGKNHWENIKSFCDGQAISNEIVDAGYGMRILVVSQWSISHKAHIMGMFKSG